MKRPGVNRLRASSLVRGSFALRGLENRLVGKSTKR